MLRQLTITNYALIDEVELKFQPGLTAITGETGSGKSILLGAFGLLLGDRADSKAIKNDKKKCIVEASFNVKENALQSFFEENDLDFEEVATIRREIAPGGKSRAFINDTPVQISTLRELGTLLVDIHSQHENSMLGEQKFQFSFVDAFAGNADQLSIYRSKYSEYTKCAGELNELLENESRLRQEFDFAKFQLDELAQANLDGMNVREMEQELGLLNNAENIKAVLNSINGILEGESSGVLAQLNLAKSILHKISPGLPGLEEFDARLESSLIEIRELTREMESYESEVHFDQEKISQLNDRLSALFALQQKHRVNEIEDLILLRTQLEEKTGIYSGFDDRISDLRIVSAKLEEELSAIARQLTLSRRKAAEVSMKKVKKYFEALSLDHAEIQINISDSVHYNSQGKNHIEFLFKANKGGQLLPIKQVASGGEISRVMLAIKASIAKFKKLPVLILDEIDQGVSGEVGKKIGWVLKEMSTEMQLLTITHLPQIAGKANQHLKVYKVVDKLTTSTYVSELNEEERVNELAEMLSGKSFTKAAMENARELMG
jgi:DNA repair protein RecN (Recombination protein N)